jgi:CBS domain-containing protein
MTMFDSDTPIRELMSKDVVVLGTGATVAEAIKTFREYTLGTSPVVDEHGECVGVFGLADLARISAEGLEATDTDTVSQWMTEKVKWLPIKATAADAMRVMAEEGIHHVIVMDEKSIRGIVSSLDLVRFVARSLPRERAKEEPRVRVKATRGSRS